MNDLTITEQASLERYERVIEKGLVSFYEVGSALLTIRDSKLYRGTHRTFEAYCQDRWQMSRPRAYQLIDAAKVKDNLSTTVDISPNERQLRPLAALPPEQQSEVWQRAVATAPKGRVTAAYVHKIVKDMTPVGQEKPRPAQQPQIPPDAIGFVENAIDQLSLITSSDPRREAGLGKLKQWLKNNTAQSKPKIRAGKCKIPPLCKKKRWGLNNQIPFQLTPGDEMGCRSESRGGRSMKAMNGRVRQRKPTSREPHARLVTRPKEYES